jgi:DNA-binding transcriptional LysR family regulator
MDFQRLRCFVRVAGTLNFTRAAEELALAQPSLSQQVRKLEGEVGFALFQRSPGATQLTAEGGMFLPYAESVLARCREAETVAEEIRGARRGRVSLGISPIAGARLLPRLLRAVRKRYPGIAVTTREAGLSELQDLLRAGEVDLAMVLLPAEEASLTCVTLLSEDLVLVLPADHRLGAREVVDAAELKDEALILMPPEYGARHLVLDLCKEQGFEPEVALESGDVGILQGLVEAGLGVTILPRSAIREDLHTVRRPIRSRGAVPKRKVGLAFRGDRYLSVAAREVFALAATLADGEGQPVGDRA